MSSSYAVVVVVVQVPPKVVVDALGLALPTASPLLSSGARERAPVANGFVTPFFNVAPAEKGAAPAAGITAFEHFIGHNGLGDDAVPAFGDGGLGDFRSHVFTF